jgi:dolichol kinase
MSSFEQVKNLIEDSEITTEVVRKSIHMLIALVPPLAALNVHLTMALLAGGVLFYTWTESLRLHGQKVAVISFLTITAARARDRDGVVLGPVTLGVGAMLALLLYPEPAAAMGIYALAFGDGLASLMGKLFGKVVLPYTGGKTIIGSSTCFLSVMLVALGILPTFGAAVIVGLSATLLEMFPTRDMDNIILPTGVGLVTWLFML